MIVDWSRFATAEKPYWDELEQVLTTAEANPEQSMSLAEAQRLHYLYERCSGDLARLDTFSAEPGLRAFLESLVSRAYGEIYESRSPLRIHWKAAIFAFPRAFRRARHPRDARARNHGSSANRGARLGRPRW